MKNGSLYRIQRAYFRHMARSYPVMCLSDEFHFMPRAEMALNYLEFLDSFDSQKIKESIRYVKDLRRQLHPHAAAAHGLEDRIDACLLRQNMNMFLLEFERVNSWKHDPNLYLKIALLGIEQPLAKLSAIIPDIHERLLKRMRKIPAFLDEAKVNLRDVLTLHRMTAEQLASRIIAYCAALSTHQVKRKAALHAGFSQAINKIAAAVEDFIRFLRNTKSGKRYIEDIEILNAVLKDGLAYNKGPDHIFKIAADEYDDALRAMRTVARSIRPSRSWKRIFAAHTVSVKDSDELIRRYAKQVTRIRNFLIDTGGVTIPDTRKIRVLKTPPFLEAIRASASYSCPISDDKKEAAVFYISAYLAGRLSGSKRMILDNIHHEYVYVTAHETYPGHHLLDIYRRRMNNPIRRQIESPLFYEGWASYAEGLIDRLGYLKDPKERLFGMKRRAWRAIRAMLDVGLRTKKLNPAKAAVLLSHIGYSQKVIKPMLEHYALTIGYQICYTIGKFEIERLRERFIGRLGLKKFNDLLLQGGQIPFDLIQKRLETVSCGRNS